MTERLRQAATVTLDGSGSGVASFSPGKYQEVWNVERMTTNGASAINPTLNIYRGSSGTDLLDTTLKANDDVSETSITLNAGELITAQYSGGSPGAIMRFYLEGEITRGI